MKPYVVRRPRLQHDALHVLPRLQEAPDEQRAEVLVLLRALAVHDVQDLLRELEGRVLEGHVAARRVAQHEPRAAPSA